MAVDIFSKTLPASFRGIGFPVSEWSQQESHEQVQHKAFDRDGARIESTGLVPRTFQLQIPLINDLRKGPSETWSALFPETYDDLTAALRDSSTGILVHPTEGDLNVKPQNFSYKFAPGMRNGIILDVSFIETIIDETLGIPSPAQFSIAAQALTSLIENLDAFDPPVDTDFDSSTFEESLRALQGVFDSVGLLEASIGGQISSMIQSLNALAASLSRACNLENTSSESVSLEGQCLDLIAQIRGTIEDVESSLNLTTKLSILHTLADQTWTQIAKQVASLSTSGLVSNTTEELMDLNPQLVDGPTVPANSEVVYRR